MSKKRVKGVYGKPLVKDLPDDADFERARQEALERAGKYAVREIQREIKRSSWNNPPTNLLKSFEYEVKNSTMVIKSDHPAAQYLNKGVEPHQMIYLERAKRPIPIITDSGEVIYRMPSSKTMADGSWQHPGIKGKHFLDRGVEKARERVKKELAKGYQDLIRKALEGE